MRYNSTEKQEIRVGGNSPVMFCVRVLCVCFAGITCQWLLLFHASLALCVKRREQTHHVKSVGNDTGKEGSHEVALFVRRMIHSCSRDDVLE